jgi:hypothetical protein
VSGHGYGDVCPNCEEPITCFVNHKPFDTVSSDCIQCGFYYHTIADQKSIEELNLSRKEYNDERSYVHGNKGYLHPMNELPTIKERLQPYINKT